MTSMDEVMIHPTFIHFRDVRTNVLLKQRFSLRNTGKDIKGIRLYEPKNKVFRVRVIQCPSAITRESPKPLLLPCDVKLAPGMSLIAVVTYKGRDELQCDDSVTIVINSHPVLLPVTAVLLPVTATPARPELTFEPFIDFGHVPPSNRILTRDWYIRNDGSKLGEFKLAYTGTSALTVDPKSGTVAPHSSVAVKVGYRTLAVGEFSEKVSIYLSGDLKPDYLPALYIKGCVVPACLQLLDDATNAKLDCVKFGTAYYGTDVTRTAVLSNSRPDAISFVLVLYDSASGQEVGLDMGSVLGGGYTNSISSMVTAFPQQGTLHPGQQIPLIFRFSPRWYTSRRGAFKSDVKLAPCQNLAMFIQVKVVGSNPVETEETASTGTHPDILEIALTGTAVPVQLDIDIPRNVEGRVDFGQCCVGQCVQIPCKIVNKSKWLPITYQTERVAHYLIKPSHASIPPSQSCKTLISFSPKQAGTFRCSQTLELMGRVADRYNPYVSELIIIQSTPISLTGVSFVSGKRNEPVFNTGITPKITNEVGLNCASVTTAELEKLPWAARVRAHRTAVSGGRGQDSSCALVALPNDRAASVRPTDPCLLYRTLFTGAPRHTYIDPDYSYTNTELFCIEVHRKYYTGFIAALRRGRRARLEMRELVRYLNNVDIGIKPTAVGSLKAIADSENNNNAAAGEENKPVNEALMTSSELTHHQQKTLNNVRDGLNAEPTTKQEKIDCKRTLSPAEILQIVIKTPTVDFGTVCVKSFTHRNVYIINSLNQFIYFAIQIDSVELLQSSPLSQVVPPQCTAVLPLRFESSRLGRYQRSLKYVINGLDHNELTVFAEVAPLQLELSTNQLHVCPQTGLNSHTNMRGTVSLFNRMNHPAQFTWSPVLDKNSVTAFTVRPATGIVEPYSEMRCEVVYHASYDSPLVSNFVVNVKGGDCHHLKCVAKIDYQKVILVESRMAFGSCALNLTTIRVTLLKNIGLLPAYFKVLDANPAPGLTVAPLSGMIMAGATTPLTLTYLPDSRTKIDAQIRVAVRSGKTLQLRVSAAVEKPLVDINMDSFVLGGVYCGAVAIQSFTLTNMCKSRVRVEFDLSKACDFKILFCENKQTSDDKVIEEYNPGVYVVTMEAEDRFPCRLVFSPVEVASYNFCMTVALNTLEAPTPAPTPLPFPGRQAGNRVVHHAAFPTPQRRIVATALRRPLLISPHLLEFSVAEQCKNSVEPRQVVHIKNCSKKEVKWLLDLTADGQSQLRSFGVIPQDWSSTTGAESQVDSARLKSFRFFRSDGSAFDVGSDGLMIVGGTLQCAGEETVEVEFCAVDPGEIKLYLPLRFSQDGSDCLHIFSYLTLRGEVRRPTLTFDPPRVLLGPVPLCTPVTADFFVSALDYFEPASVSATLPTIVCEDGCVINDLSIELFAQPDSFCSERSSTITVSPLVDSDGSKSHPYVFHGRITFCSARPVSWSNVICFTDSYGRDFPLALTVTADNSLLTCYPFLASHAMEYQIVCEQGKILRGHVTDSKESLSLGEPVLVPFGSAADGSSHYRPNSGSSNTTSTLTLDHSASCDLDSTQQSPAVYDSIAPNKSRRPNAGTPISHQYHDHRLEAAGADDQLLAKTLDLFPASTDENGANREDDLYDDDEEDTGSSQYCRSVLRAVGRWFTAEGWPLGPNTVSIPSSLCRSLTTKLSPAQTRQQQSGGSLESASVVKETRTIYEMILHLSGRSILDCDPNKPLPSLGLERVLQIHRQHSALLDFVKLQGGCLGSVRPEYLMEYNDFRDWMKNERAKLLLAGSSAASVSFLNWLERMERMSERTFESLSTQAWLTVLLQILKTVVLGRVTPRQFCSSLSPSQTTSPPSVDPNPLRSNIYSVSERILLAWINQHYEQQRTVVWSEKQLPDGSLTGVPAPRWIVNFDFDLLDGLVLATAIAAYIPFLIESHLRHMHAQPTTPEKCLHNAILLLDALRSVGVDYDVEPIDITCPNPISMLLLVLHLYFVLPEYIARSSVEFVGKFGEHITAQVKLSNPAAKPIVYRALLAGRDARHFSIMDNGSSGKMADTVCVAQKSSSVVTLSFLARFISSAEAVLIFAPRKQKTGIGSTLVFNLKSLIVNLEAKATVKVESPCYTPLHIQLPVVNTYEESGRFQILIIELEDDSGTKSGRQGQQKSKRRNNTALIQSIAENEETGQSSVSVRPGHNFYSKQRSIYLQSNCPVTLDLTYIPLYEGQHECTVILRCEGVGEMIYVVKGTASMPDVMGLPWVESSAHCARISSVAAIASGIAVARKTRDETEGAAVDADDDSAYFRCSVGQRLDEVLHIPVLNKALEQAAVAAASMCMSEVELSQRSRTGIMLTHNQLSHLTQQLSTNNNNNMKNNNSDIRNSHHTVAYTVEVNSRYFSPSSSTLHIPVTDADGLETVPLSLTFEALDSGTYSCDLLLKSAADVRRHRVVVLVLAAGSAADPIIEFCSSLHQPITQNIPVINSTSVDWLMMSELSGLGFSGPKELCVKRHSVSQFPLKFSPKRQGYVEGRLVLRNAMDDVEYRYNLRGRGEKCPAVDTLSFTAQVNQCLTQSIPVQNITDKRVLFKVETDLAFLVGNESLVVLSHQTGCYDLSLTPPRRGRHQGVLAFIATEPNKDYDSDSEYLSDTTTSRETQVSSTLEGFRVWYHVDLYAEPADPVSVLDLAGPCQKQVSLNLPIQNPTEESVTFEVTTEGHGLCGPRRLVVGPNATENCLILFSPTVVGDFVGSVVFYHTVVGEFWYCIRLTAESPYLTVMPVLEAELGRGCMQDIELNNSTSEALVLHPHVTNPVHFTLLLSEVQTMTGVVEVNPSETVYVPVVFTPSELGTGDHSGSIIFSSAQLGNMEYRVCGKGLLPITCDRLDVRAMVGTNASATINFTNPTDVPIIITVALREMSTSGYWSSKREQPAGSIQSPFHVLLKRASQGVCLEARERVQIPISFTPTSMCCYETRCELTARRQDGQDWIETVNNQCTVGSDSYICNKYPSVIWSYVLRGYAEGQTPNLEPLTPLTFSARTNCRLEERLDLLLTGSEGGARCEEGGGGWVDCVGRVMKRRPASPVQRPQVEEQQHEQEEPREEEEGEEAERYEYYIEYGSESTREALEACYALQLIGQGRDERTNLTMLTFSVIYSPTKLMTCDVTLVVQRCGSGVDGLWRYPLQFYCTEIEPNCVIDIQSAALNTVSCLSLTVRNQTDACEQYTAQFVGSSDTALFTVTPQNGTLPPCSSEEGLALTISYCPNMYGRRHRVRLLIQTETAQWTYDVRGVLPVYVPPHYHSAPNSVTSLSRQTSSNCGSSVNHVISNLRLSATAASSPFKRQPLLSRRKTCPAIHLEKSSG